MLSYIVRMSAESEVVESVDVADVRVRPCPPPHAAVKTAMTARVARVRFTATSSVRVFAIGCDERAPTSRYRRDDGTKSTAMPAEGDGSPSGLDRRWRSPARYMF